MQNSAPRGTRDEGVLEPTLSWGLPRGREGGGLPRGMGEGEWDLQRGIWVEAPEGHGGKGLPRGMGGGGVGPPEGHGMEERGDSRGSHIANRTLWSLNGDPAFEISQTGV